MLTREQIVDVVHQAIRGSQDYRVAAQLAVDAMDAAGVLTVRARPPAPGLDLFIEPPAAGGGSQ